MTQTAQLIYSETFESHQGGEWSGVFLYYWNVELRFTFIEGMILIGKANGKSKDKKIIIQWPQPF